MRSLCIAAVAIVVAIAPAFAQSARKARTYRAPPVRSYDAYAGKKRYYGDPDPNVQFDLMRERNWRKGG